MAAEEQAVAKRVDVMMAEWTKISESEPSETPELVTVRLEHAACRGALPRVAILVFVLAIACKRKDVPERRSRAGRHRCEPKLLLTWIDEKGDFHSEQRPTVPDAAREVVRVAIRAASDRR